ncbi:MAG: glycosyltransferase family 9 protein [Planctomycetota bacterium]|nr:glycosyltransferase family 9 protein [Planctomycetota bacterium]
MRGFLTELRSTTYDVVLDLQGNLKSGVVTRAARAGLRMGFDRRAAREANHLFTSRRWLPPADLAHRVERGLGLAGALLGRPLPYVAPGYPVAPEDEAAARDARARAGDAAAPYVVLHPGTSGFGAFKRWPADRFAAVARRLLAAGRRVLVTYGPGEAALAEAVVKGAGPGPIAAVAPASLGALAALIRDADGFLSGDTGPLHLAGLLGTPLLGLFGPKDPATYGPYGLRGNGEAGLLATLTQPDVACRPCTLRRCADPLCMTTMEPERVAQAFADVIAG